jgi:hypothetical protein
VTPHRPEGDWWPASNFVRPIAESVSIDLSLASRADCVSRGRLQAARRHHTPDRITAILTVPGSPQLPEPAALIDAYTATLRSLIAVITVLNEQITALEGKVTEHFGRRPGARRTRP